MVTGPTQQRFEYDLSGRILFKSDVGAYDYADPGHPSAPTRAGKRLLAYDAGGNQVAHDDETRVWNAENRLAQVKTASGVIQYGYDQSGARVERRSGTKITRYFGQLAEMADGKLVKYFYAGPMLVCRRDADGGVWYHADHLGPPRTLTDGTGAVLKRNTYRAYGEADYADSAALASVGFRRACAGP